MTNLKPRSHKQRIFRKVGVNFLKYLKKKNPNFFTENRKDYLKWKCPQNRFQDYNLNGGREEQDSYKNFILIKIIKLSSYTLSRWLKRIRKLDFNTIRENNENTAEYVLLMAPHRSHAARLYMWSLCWGLWGWSARSRHIQRGEKMLPPLSLHKAPQVWRLCFKIFFY